MSALQIPDDLQIPDGIHLEVISYTRSMRQWMNGKRKNGKEKGHYLENAPPGCLFAVGVYRAAPGLFPGTTQPSGPIQGICLIGRPIARKLPQDGSVGEVTRMYLCPGLPPRTASAVLRYAAAIARTRRIDSLIAYHDRTRHTGCIYRKAGFRKDGITDPPPNGWGTRSQSAKSAKLPTTSKRRWRLHLSPEPTP
jgi:hypothetical protein